MRSIIRTVQACFLMTEESLLTQFKNRLLQQGYSDITIKGYLYDLNHFLRWFAEMHPDKDDINVKDVGDADLRAYRQELINVRRQKAASVNRRLQAIKSFFTWATQVKAIAKNSAQDVRFMKKKAPLKPLALNRSEVHALLRVADLSPHGLSARNCALLQLILQAGLRIGEVVKLQFRDITINRRSGSVRIYEGKGFKEREVPLNSSARQALSTYIEPRQDIIQPEDPLFITKQGTVPTVRALQLVVTNLARRAKIARIKVTPHTLRHTFATNFLQSNPDSLVELAMLLGHESLNTTAIYTKASLEKLEQGVERSEINIYDE